jgi:branched-chain amino acid aminotransferase
VATVVWLNGELLPIEQARISPLDHGPLVGDGVFETLRVYDGIPFAWRRHIARLRASAAGLGLSVPGGAVLRAAADAVIAANGHAQARLRITITGGPAPPGSSRDGSAGPTVFLLSFPMGDARATTDVVVVPWTRNEGGAVAGLKTISYAENVRALAYAEARDAGEAVFANTRGELCEATGSNVFVVSGGVVATPPAASGCLLGVTRALVLELCASLGIPAEEKPLDLAVLGAADEAFLSSTTREVQPIERVDGAVLPQAPGPVTERLALAFRDLVARNLDP